MSRSTEIIAEIIGPQDWEQHKEQLMLIEAQAFGENAFPPDELEYLITDDTNISIIARNLDTIIGYMNASPKNKNTAHIMSTAILPPYQGQGIVGILSQALENELIAQGYSYFSRDAADNGFADKINRHYGERVIKFGPSKDSEFGPQRYIKIRLG